MGYVEKYQENYLKNERFNTDVRLVNATDEAPRMKMCVIFCNAVIKIPLGTASPLGCNLQFNSVIRTECVTFELV